VTLPNKRKFDPAFSIADKDGKPTQAFALYLANLDALVAAMASGNLPTLVNAVNDAAAAAAGVAIGMEYRNGSQLMVRVV
jgi:uncharacterized lipoprotein YajG